MKALILNSGTGSRMGNLSSKLPKCLTPISSGETILSRSLSQLADFGINQAIITTGYYDKLIKDYCDKLALPIEIEFVKNPLFDKTNYIYSIECAKHLLDDDILLMHGDLVLENSVMEKLLDFDGSCMITDSSISIDNKDFKAVVENGRITAIGVDLAKNAVAAQPLYKLEKKAWKVWLEKISSFCRKGKTECYAEYAFNEVSNQCVLFPLDIDGALCAEIDTKEDLKAVNKRLKQISKKSVYMSFSTDILHGGHMAIVKKAARWGKLTIGLLTDTAVASYKKFPMITFEERKTLFEGIKGIESIVKQHTLSYKDNIMRLKPDYIVHGDDWKQGSQLPVRKEVITLLEKYGGRLIEYPYQGEKYKGLELELREKMASPDMRRGRLKKLLNVKPIIRVLEAHSGITGLIAENTVVHKDGKALQFDAMWLSSLCDSTAKGKPDIEVVDMSSRSRTIDDILEVTTKPIILDGDTGGLTEHFVYWVKTLERMGVSAIIIEDKTGLKRNSLFGTDVVQTQESIENFSAKIAAGKASQRTKEFMIIARIESLILEQGMDDALNRAFAFVKAGADGIMIHSRKKDPSEIIKFVTMFRAKDTTTPIVVVPTSFNVVTEDEFEKIGVNIVIYANQLTRSGIPAMKKTAESLLYNQRAKEVDDSLMSINEILTLIPE